MKSQISILKLVYPPISNQYAEWLSKDSKEIRDQLKDSNLYMIVQRAEAKFCFSEDPNEAMNKEKTIFKAQITVEDIVDDFEKSISLKLFLMWEAYFLFTSSGALFIFSNK